jgi:hypothetical protein
MTPQGTMNMGPKISAEEKTQWSIGTVESFFALIDSKALFRNSDPVFLREVRNNVRLALSHLLVWGRPVLQTTLGLNWPYEELKERHHILTALAAEENDSFLQRQAHLFLAMLPFPKQWFWLLRAERQYRNDPEMEKFLDGENAKVAAKLQEKVQKEYKLSHFCQVLKGPRKNEKGVLRVFSIPYALIRPELLRELNRKYILYVEPTAGVVFRHTWLRHLSVLEDPCVVGVGSSEDINFLNSQMRVEAIPLAHGDYLEEDISLPTEEVRQYDIVFNGKFDDLERKRHELMLYLLNDERLSDTKALFLGRGEERDIQYFRNLVNQAGLASRVTVIANVRRQNIPAYLARCKMGVHLALHENGCRCLYEYFRSDLPCVASSSMGGMNMTIFNDDTGMAVPDRKLARAISFVLTHGHRFRPRRWFLANSGSANSSQKLNRILQQLFEKMGYQWREDIVPLLSGGPGRYANRSDSERFKDEFHWIWNCLNNSGKMPIRILAP